MGDQGMGLNFPVFHQIQYNIKHMLFFTVKLHNSVGIHSFDGLQFQP